MQFFIHYLINGFSFSCFFFCCIVESHLHIDEKFIYLKHDFIILCIFRLPMNAWMRMKDLWKMKIAMSIFFLLLYIFFVGYLFVEELPLSYYIFSFCWVLLYIIYARFIISKVINFNYICQLKNEVKL